MVEAINAQALLPKYIIVILEADLIKVANHHSDGISQMLSQWVDWVANEYHRIIVSHKEKLPTKSRKFKYPQILWIATVHHNYFSSLENNNRKKFNTCLFSIAEMYREVSVLMLHTWDTRDSTLIADSNDSFTHRGK